VLGLASPTHPLPAQVRAWTATFQWRTSTILTCSTAGRCSCISLACLDRFRGIQDAFMREKGSDYFQNSRRATLIQREYARRNPHGFAGYGKDCWASRRRRPGPRWAARQNGTVRQSSAMRLAVYLRAGHGMIAPSAALASLPLRPSSSFMRAPPLHANIQTWCVTANCRAAQSDARRWRRSAWSRRCFVLIKAHRTHDRELSFGTDLEVDARMSHIRTGLLRAGFNGGWL